MSHYNNNSPHPHDEIIIFSFSDFCREASIRVCQSMTKNPEEKYVGKVPF